MLQKFTEEKIEEILEIGISHFAEYGFENANMAKTAKEAGISVGVLYKYYGDKEGFFFACLDRSLKALDDALQEVLEFEEHPREFLGRLLDLLISSSKKHSNYVQMYLEITGSGGKKYSNELAERIEKQTAEAYRTYMQKAQERGLIRKDLSPEYTAFFFDNLLMMLQFSYGGPYYKKRMELFVGEDAFTNDARMQEELLKFLSYGLEEPLLES